jgi:hypothetical protein
MNSTQRIDHARERAFQRYLQASTNASYLRDANGYLPRDSWEARRLLETYLLWNRLVRISDAHALRYERTTPEQVVAKMSVCMKSPTLRHDLYDGAAGGQVCVWCHYGEEN